MFIVHHSVLDCLWPINDGYFRLRHRHTSIKKTLVGIELGCISASAGHFARTSTAHHANQRSLGFCSFPLSSVT